MDNDDKVKGTTERVQLLEDRTLVRLTQNENQFAKLSPRIFSFKSIQEKFLTRVEKLETNFEAKQNEEIYSPTHRYSDKSKQ